MNNNKKELLKESLASILKPVAKLLMGNSITYRELIDVAKLAFYEAGLEITRKDGAEATNSSLSLLTGLHRKDISLFANKFEEIKKKSLEKKMSSGTAIVAEWLTSSVYIDEKNHPLTLKYSGESPSFTKLVESISSDIRPRTHLDELIRLGVVDFDGEHVSLKTEAFIPKADFSEKIKYFTRNVRDHIAASSSNMESDNPQYFDRSAFHGELSKQDIAVIKKFLDKEGMALLKKAYQMAEELSKKNTTDATQRVTIGLYMYNEENNEKPSS